MAYSQIISQIVCVIVLSTSCLAAPTEVKNDVTEVKNDVAEINFLMPDVQPQVDETYLCYPMKVEKTMYITGFQPKATMMTAHHILIYGCSELASTDKVWNCGEMHHNSENYPSAPVCGGESKIIYAWAMDAPELRLPKGVAFKVGDDTDIKYLTLQVHYKNVSPFLPPKNGKDNSGVVLLSTETPQPKRAGVYLLGTMGEIPPHSTVYMETACSYNDDYTLHPFAFRTHAHTHGKVVAGYRVRDSKWTEIGRKSPQLPQMFYNVTTPGVTVEPGDILAARCTMVSDENDTIQIGGTGKDEMCNFYMMYYVEGNQITKDNYCFSPGPPTWNWMNMDGLNPLDAPEEASIIPGTSDFIKSTEQLMEHMDNYMDMEKEQMDENLRRVLASLEDNENYRDLIDSKRADEEEAEEEYYPSRFMDDQFVENIDEI